VLGSVIVAPWVCPPCPLRSSGAAITRLSADAGSTPDSRNRLNNGDAVRARGASNFYAWINARSTASTEFPAS
jgi:hypothetical protein